MNPSLASTLSEFTKKSEFSRRGLAAELSDEPPLHPSELNRLTRAWLWIGRLIPFAFIRFVIIFFIGVSVTLAWQSYGNAAREMISSWSSRLAWLAPPAEQTGASTDQIVAISRDLAAMRQGIDKLAAELSKLHAPQQGAPDRSASASSPAAVPARKPGPQMPAAARAAPPVR